MMKKIKLFWKIKLYKMRLHKIKITMNNYKPIKINKMIKLSKNNSVLNILKSKKEKIRFFCNLPKLIKITLKLCIKL